MKRSLRSWGWASVHQWALSLPLALTLGSRATQATEPAWWQFRGPNGDGHTTATNLPLAWDESRNVAWKTAIHDRGWSSPVVGGDQVWLTTATRDGHRLFAVCVDKTTGTIVHDLPVFEVENPMRITDENTYATPTPVIEEGRVFVHFGTYGTACLDTATGRTLWTRRDLNCDHEVGAGPASSPTLIDGKVVVHVDGDALIIRTENSLYRIENARNEPDRNATLRLTAERQDIDLSIKQPDRGKETTP